MYPSLHPLQSIPRVFQDSVTKSSLEIDPKMTVQSFVTQLSCIVGVISRLCGAHAQVYACVPENNS